MRHLITLVNTALKVCLNAAIFVLTFRLWTMVTIFPNQTIWTFGMVDLLDSRAIGAIGAYILVWPKFTRVPKRDAGAGVGVGMLRDGGFP